MEHQSRTAATDSSAAIFNVAGVADLPAVGVADQRNPVASSPRNHPQM
jgi:hypothetical protein